MKVYVYYLINQKVLYELNSYGVLDSFADNYEKGKPYLYAYTNDKDVAEIFELIRNPDVFLKKTIKMDKSEFAEFSNRYSTFCKIGVYPMRYEYERSVYLPITLGEYWYTIDSRRETICDILSKLTKINIDIFRIDAREIFQNVNYDKEVLRTDERPMIPTVSQEYIDKYGWKNEVALFSYLYRRIIHLEILAEVIQNEQTKNVS